MTWRARTLMTAGVLCALTSLTAERPAAQDPAPVFRSESNLVVVHVNVFDGRSDAVPNLPQSAFHVLEDGKPQTITFFSNEDVPVAVGLIIDNSGSMITRRNMVLAGTRAFAESSHDQDELFTIVFNEHIQFGLPKTVAFTRSRPQIQASLTQFMTGGMTALHDAVIAGLEHLQEASHQKRVLVVLSDGDDNASQHSEDNMLDRARRSDALIYVVSTAELGTNVGKPRLLKKLADVSGGEVYRPEKEAEVVKAFTEIADNIRRGYSIGYVPTNNARDGKLRRLKVTVYAPGYKNLSVSARDGYLAPRDIDAR
jgi:Ca-activated chloride channel family protein